jgi:predicted nucleotidyltransferase
MTSAQPMASIIETLPERKYLRRLLHTLPPTEPVVLIGSWARGTVASEWSDIDVLVVGNTHPALAPPRLQVMTISLSELRRRLMKGDDFPQWALRFGVPIAGRRLWDRLRRELLGDAPWPDPLLKLSQAKKKLETAETLLAIGDLAAAEEEIRFGLSHVARAELLSRNVFPLSRPELAGQLEEIGDHVLERMIRRANAPSPMTKAEIEDAVHLVRKRLAGVATF